MNCKLCKTEPRLNRHVDYCRRCLGINATVAANADLILEALYDQGHIILPPPFVKLDADAMQKAYIESQIKAGGDAGAIEEFEAWQKKERGEL